MDATEALTRHQIMIQRYGSGEFKKLEPILKAVAQDVRARLMLEPTQLAQMRLTELLDDINAIIAGAGDQMTADLFDDLIEFAEYESEFTQRIFAPLVSADTVLPSIEQIRAAMTTSKATLVSGKTIKRMGIKELVAAFTGSKQKEVDLAIRAGFIEGKTSQELSRQLQSILGKKAPRQAAVLVRTATNHAGSVARKEFAAANRDVIESEEWVSTLDGHTTLFCMAHDGNVYRTGKGPYPPAHYGCRSIRVPKVDPKYSILGGRSKRSSMDGPVNASLTYSGFLNKQSKQFQDDVLGKARADLFRSGKFTLKGFVDDMGRTLTLDQLREREGLTL